MKTVILFEEKKEMDDQRSIRIRELEDVRLQLLRDLRDRAQVLGKRSVVHYGLSRSQIQQLNEFAVRLRRSGPDNVVVPGSSSGGNYAGLKKQLRDATSQITALRKEVRSAQQDRALLGSGRWGNPGYLRNSFDGIGSGSNSSGMSSVHNGNMLPPTGRQRRGPRNVADIEVDDELSALRLTCARLKTELGLPSNFQYDDLDTYSMSEVESARAGKEELERQNEALEAERTALIASNQTLQSQQAAALLKVDQVLSNRIMDVAQQSTNVGNSNNNTTMELTQLQSQCYQLHIELNRSQSTLKQLQTRENRANKILASQQRRSNEMIDCSTELLSLRRALEASQADLERTQLKNKNGSEEEELISALGDLFDELADDIDKPGRILPESLLRAVQTDANGDRNAELDDTLNKHWSLRMLRSLLISSSTSTNGTEGEEEVSVAAQTLVDIASKTTDQRLGMGDVAEFCLGPLLALYFSSHGNLAAMAQTVKAKLPSSTADTSTLEEEGSKEQEEPAVVVAVPSLLLANISRRSTKQAWSSSSASSSTAKQAMASNEEIKRLKRKVMQLEELRRGATAPHRMVQVFEKKYAEERNRNGVLRSRCEQLQVRLTKAQETATGLGYRVKEMEAAKENEQMKKEEEEKSDGTSSGQQQQQQAPKETDVSHEYMQQCQHEIDCLRESNRRLLRLAKLDETYTFPNLLIENSVKTKMDEMKEANESIARSSRDQLWDARRKIAVLERKLAKETRRSQKYATMATDKGGSDRDIRLTLSLQKRTEQQAATIRKLAVRLQNAESSERKYKLNASKGKRGSGATDARVESEDRHDVSKVNKDSKDTKKKSVQEVTEVGRMITAPGKPRNKEMEDMVAELQRENRKLKKRNLRLADALTLMKLRKDADDVKQSSALSKSSSGTIGNSKKKKKRGRRKKDSAKNSLLKETNNSRNVVGGLVKQKEENDGIQDRNTSAMMTTLRKHVKRLEIENGRLETTNKILSARAAVSTQMVAGAHANAQRSYESMLLRERDGNNAKSKANRIISDHNKSNKSSGRESPNPLRPKSMNSGAPVLRMVPERPNSAGPRSSGGTGKSAKTGTKRSGKRSSKRSTSISEQQNLQMKSELNILRSTRTELEKELALTRTMCHELEATSRQRDDKLQQLERALVQDQSNSSNDLTAQLIGYTADSTGTLLIQAHRQIERLHRVLHEKQLELHAFTAMSDGGTTDISARLETEHAIDEYFTEIQRLTKELKKSKNRRDTDREKLQRRLATQIKACEDTREAANRALESVLEVYPEALSLITESSLKGNTPTNSPSPSSGMPTSGKSSPMSLILEQGGRVRRVDSDKAGATGGMSMSTTKRGGDRQSAPTHHNILEWTPAQVGAWLANEVNLPHLVPKFVSEAVDGQLLLTLTDADLAGELGMMDKSRKHLVVDDIHAVERKRVMGAITDLRAKNKAYRQKQKNAKAASSEHSSPTKQTTSSVLASSLHSVTSPGQLERRLSQIPTDSERIEVLSQELLSMQANHSTLRQQHAALSKNWDREKEQSKVMRTKHEEERKLFEQNIMEEQRVEENSHANKAKPIVDIPQIPPFSRSNANAESSMDPAAAAAQEAAAKEAAAKEAAAKEKKARLKAMFAVNEIPSFHTVRPPKGLVKKHEPRQANNKSAVKSILKTPTFSSSPTKHALKQKDAHKKLTFLPPEQNSLAIIPRVDEEQNEELWWTMEDLDRSSAEADQEAMVEELEKLEELRLKQGGQLTPQQQQTENDLRMQLAQAQQEQHMQQVRV